jgi:hypothetical protein
LFEIHAHLPDGIDSPLSVKSWQKNSFDDGCDLLFVAADWKDCQFQFPEGSKYQRQASLHRFA